MKNESWLYKKPHKDRLYGSILTRIQVLNNKINQNKHDKNKK